MKLSASRMGLAKLCLYWARHDVGWPPRDTSPAAEIGTWYHDVCCWTIGVATGLLPVETPIPKPPACMGDANELTPQADARALVEEFEANYDIRAEVAYVYNPAGVRHAGFDVGRDYGEVGPADVPGTADVVLIAKDKSRVIVVDWKSGQRVDDAKENGQLAFLALCVHRYHGIDEVEVQLRYPDGYVDRHTFDAFDLADIKDRVDAIISEGQGEPEPNPGIHCTSRYCPIRATCPATFEAIGTIMDEPRTALDLRSVSAGSDITSAEHAATLWHRAAVAQALLDNVVTAVKKYTDVTGPIPLGDGKELACVDETRETIDASTIQAIYEPIAHWISADKFAKCVNVTVPKTALEKAIKEGCDRGQKTIVWKSAIEALHGAQVIKSKTITRHRVRKARK